MTAKPKNNSLPNQARDERLAELERQIAAEDREDRREIARQRRLGLPEHRERITTYPGFADGEVEARPNPTTGARGSDGDD
jgi:hypothetical protein